MWYKNLLKAELHIHIEGTLEPEMMFKLAKRNDITLPYKDINEVKAAYNFQNLQSFLDVYYRATNVLMTEQDFYDLTWAYLEKASAQGIVHVEIFFDPQTHTNRGITFDVVVKGIHRALEDGQLKLNITGKLIMCFLRDHSLESAQETLAKALEYKSYIVGVGLDSAELDHPPEKFEHIFKSAREAGFRTVAHAGEEGPPEYIWQAIEILQVERIDHGIKCVEDTKLVDYLVKHRIPLTVCPLSNVKLRVVDSLKDHPLKRMLDLGLCVTINSDDPAYLGGYLMENLIETTQALNLSDQDILQLVQNSFEASFITEEQKHQYLNAVNITKRE